ncbi:hypothetical protein SCNU_17270 [Gordonia neofelifaecis NRRL B-59395]|uniref:Uncharacterized protein n=1 Tax=Gordonia neofelifaecis NRRL B-59395 TaxID=644548 RepID=F1YNF5_9ACTN|nr:hypothetical protein SCNU_17270 [Gordonia neofelifaecis NRRL B-59395]
MAGASTEVVVWVMDLSSVKVSGGTIGLWPAAAHRMGVRCATAEI